MWKRDWKWKYLFYSVGVLELEVELSAKLYQCQLLLLLLLFGSSVVSLSSVPHSTFSWFFVDFRSFVSTADVPDPDAQKEKKNKKQKHFLPLLYVGGDRSREEDKKREELWWLGSKYTREREGPSILCICCMCRGDTDILCNIYHPSLHTIHCTWKEKRSLIWNTRIVDFVFNASGNPDFLLSAAQMVFLLFWPPQQ